MNLLEDILNAAGLELDKETKITVSHAIRSEPITIRRIQPYESWAIIYETKDWMGDTTRPDYFEIIKFRELNPWHSLALSKIAKPNIIWADIVETHKISLANPDIKNAINAIITTTESDK